VVAIAEAAERLSDRLAGDVLQPEDAGYEEARRSFNGMLDRRPALVVRCATAADVSAAAACAHGLDLPIAIRGGGHSVAGHGIGDGALVVDLSRLRRVEVDADRRRARVEGGALWEDVDVATQAVGLAVPGGTYGDTGVGGLTLGGGLGWLLGTAGLSCDNLVRAELVTPAGETVIAGEDGDPELLWALRGGGGNFGIVTRFELRLHPCGQMTGGYVSFALDELGEILLLLEELGASAAGSLVVMPWIGPGEACNVGVAFAGSSDEAERVLAPLRRERRPLLDEIGPKSYLEIQEMNGRLPFGLRHYWTGHFVHALGRDAIEAIERAVRSRPVDRTGILMEQLTGAARAEPPGGAAFGQRSAGWNVSALAVWDDPADDESCVAWARATAASLAPHSVTGGGYVNYMPADDTPDRTLAAYGPERFERLRAVKRRYDPENRLRFNFNIPPGTV
jgi:FAD/FMN-containing dehydrogenase